ncbi:MAG: ACP S-malonyltransferase [Chlamydiia bacterium]|nr:ACP S-malonyltransferase [Chlamydiia bacterium]
MKKIAFLFPGQGAQYPGMGGEFVEQFAVARRCFEEADDVLERSLSEVVLKGSEEDLKRTVNSQCGIFTASMALLRVFEQEFPELKPQVAAGLSLGEYSALCAMGWVPFADALKLVERRAALMEADCEEFPGGMAAVVGMGQEGIEKMLQALAMPDDLWAANFLSPVQVTLAGTKKGIEVLLERGKSFGAKRVIPLAVQGAFHSGLMRRAAERLSPAIEQAPFVTGKTVVSNVSAEHFVDCADVKRRLVEQVCHPVYWEKGVRKMEAEAFIEIGPGRVLAGMNRKIGVTAPTFNLEMVADLEQITKELA